MRLARLARNVELAPWRRAKMLLRLIGEFSTVGVVLFALSVVFQSISIDFTSNFKKTTMAEELKKTTGKDVLEMDENHFSVFRKSDVG